MADRTEASITVAAAPQAVLDVVADIAAYPEWANGITQAEVVEPGPAGRPGRARFRIEAGPVRDDYVVGYTWTESPDGPSSVTWSLVSAEVLTAMDGAYVVTPVEGGCEVAYRLTVDLRMPMIGLLKRKAERAVVDTALKDLKRRVEG